MPGNHVNVFGYPAYQPSTFFTHEPKSKSDHHKNPPTSGLIVAKSNAVEREREGLPNPPPLMSELKNSVIVKHDGKNPHLLEPRVSSAHSQSPKLRDMMSHYVVPTSTPTHKSNLYEYRSPTQSPHHLAHTPSPHHHLEPQNLGKVTHHRTTGQIPSPHHQRQSPHPHAQQHPSPELRYRTTSESQAMIFPTSGKPSYPYIASTASIAHYSAPAGTVSNTKPKVSSPAPHHIYGKPPVVGPAMAVTRPLETVSSANPIPLTSKPPLTSSVSPSPYQQVSHYNAPHPQATPMTNCLPPPPAHTNRTSTPLGQGMYDRLYASGSVKPTVQLGTSPPSAPSSGSRSQYNATHPAQNLTASSVQTQPLDLGVPSNRYDSAMSPKRKGTPVGSGGNGPVCLEKKRKLDSPSQQQQQQSMFAAQQQPQLARVSEPSPLIASAATTITTVVNTAAYTPPGPLMNTQSQAPISEALPDVSVTPVTVVPVETPRPPSAEEAQTPASTAVATPPSTTPTPTNSIAQLSVDSPAKSVTPGVVDSEKSNSPGPIKSASYPVRHLKKAWLQRHTGEDLEDTTGVTGSGSCVTLPLNIINTPAPAKESPVTSLHSIGSMAVNSINKTKHLSAKTNNRKGNHKNSSSINGHQTDLTKGDDSSSSDQERGRKSPPKRKPPKVKRKKGGGPTKKVSEEQKRRKVVGNQSVAASESGSESDKESGSEKDSDSGASTTLPSTKKNNTTTTTTATTTATVVNNKEKEPRKRGRRPKTSKNDKGEEPRPKKPKEESPLPQRDPFRKPPVGQLKKTGESFLQDGPCFEVAPKLGKCRECRWTPNQRTKNMPNIFCRFYAFRRLRYTKNGQLAIAGFSDPNKDALEVRYSNHPFYSSDFNSVTLQDDLKLWLPSPEVPPSDLDLETSRFILKQVGDHFCDLLVQEKDACSEHMSEGNSTTTRQDDLR